MSTDISDLLGKKMSDGTVCGKEYEKWNSINGGIFIKA